MQLHIVLRILSSISLMMILSSWNMFL